MSFSRKLRKTVNSTPILLSNPSHDHGIVISSAMYTVYSDIWYSISSNSEIILYNTITVTICIGTTNFNCNCCRFLNYMFLFICYTVTLAHGLIYLGWLYREGALSVLHTTRWIIIFTDGVCLPPFENIIIAGILFARDIWYYIFPRPYTYIIVYTCV